MDTGRQYPSSSSSTMISRLGTPTSRRRRSKALPPELPALMRPSVLIQVRWSWLSTVKPLTTPRVSESELRLSAPPTPG